MEYAEYAQTFYSRPSLCLYPLWPSSLPLGCLDGRYWQTLSLETHNWVFSSSFLYHLAPCDFISNLSFLDLSLFMILFCED
jgi:hypothetical protein